MDMLKKIHGYVIRIKGNSRFTIPIIDSIFCLIYHTKQMQNNSRHFVDVE